MLQSVQSDVRIPVHTIPQTDGSASARRPGNPGRSGPNFRAKRCFPPARGWTMLILPDSSESSRRLLEEAIADRFRITLLVIGDGNGITVDTFVETGKQWREARSR